MTKQRTKTFKRSDLVARVVEEMGIPATISQKMVGDLLDLMTDCLVSKEVLKVTSFATFQPYKRQVRKGRNLMTGESVDIASRYVIRFNRSEYLDKRYF